MFKYCIYKFGQFCLRCLPPRISLRLAVFMSDLHYYFAFKDRWAVTNNLRAILGEKENIPLLTKEVFRNFGRYLFEFFMMRRMVDEEYIKKNVVVKNLDRLQEALKQGKGGIVITAHLGNWELGGVFLNLLGYPLVGIALPHKERPVNDLFNQQRRLKGITVVSTHMALRKCLGTLKKNKLIALVADRDFSFNGEPMDFLGRKTLIPPGPAMFSLMTGSPIIPTFLIRQEDNTFVLSVEEPIYPPAKIEKKDEHQLLRSIMQKYISIIEEKIRLYPTQWLMFRPFWMQAPRQGLYQKSLHGGRDILRRMFHFKKRTMEEPTVFKEAVQA